MMVKEKEEVGELDLSTVLDALSDETRRRVLLGLSRADFCCSSFASLGPKTRMTYHFSRLRQAGLIHTTKAGTRRILTLRRRAVDAAFPGLLGAVLESEAKSVGADFDDQFPVGTLSCADETSE